MQYADPYKCVLEQRYDGVVFVINHGETPALDLQDVEHYDPAEYDSIDIDAIVERFYELSREPRLQQLFVTNAVLRMRKAVKKKKHVVRKALQIIGEQK